MQCSFSWTEHPQLWQVHLTVDTGMETGGLGISAFVARKMVLGDRVLARHFQEVDCEVRTAEAELVGGAPSLDQQCMQARTAEPAQAC